MTADFRKRTVGEQLSDTIARDIARGRFVAGSRLPSVRKMAREYGVALRSMEEAWRLLNEQGLIEVKPRSGGYVRGAQGGGRRIIFPYPVNDDAPVLAFVGGDAWGSRLIAGMREAFARHGYTFDALPYARNQPGGIERIADDWRRHRADIAGMIGFGGLADPDPLIDLVDDMQLPWVTVTATRQFPTVNFVSEDHARTGYAVGRGLAQLGKHNVAMVTGGLRIDQSHADFFAGLLQGFDSLDASWHGLRMIDTGLVDVRDYMAVTRQRMIDDIRANGTPQAIIGNDGHLLGVIDALRRLQIDTPGDVTLMGLTGLAIAERTDPKLTTIDSPMAELAQRAAAMLIEQIHTGRRHIPGTYFSASLTVRRSLPIPDDIADDIRAALRIAATSQHDGRAHLMGG